MVEQNPTDAFSRYGLALEPPPAGKLEEAVGQFVTLLEHSPRLYGEIGTFRRRRRWRSLSRALSDARGLYRRSIEAASAAGDDHAASGDAGGNSIFC